MKAFARAAAFGALAFIAVLAFGASPASAQNKCLSGKTKCVNKKMSALLKCHNKAEKSGFAVDPLCLQKAYDKFDGGTKGITAGCFAKLEIKYPLSGPGPYCLTYVDRIPQEAKVDAFVLDVVQELDPSYPTPILNKCSAGKKKCVLKKASSLLKCREKCQKDSLSCTGVLTECLAKAQGKFDGGTELSSGCFEKLEAKPPCLTNDDTAVLEAKVDAFVADVRSELENLATPTPGATTTPTPTVTNTPTPCTTSTPGIVCPTQVEVSVTGDATTTDLDIGWTGMQSDAHTGSMGRLTLNVSACSNPTSSTCGVCNTSGPIANAGGKAFNNHRCVGDTSKECTSDGDCVGGSGPCHFFFGAPLPLSAGGAFVCVTNDIGQPVTGTVDIEAGATQVSVPLTSRVYSGPTANKPCPTCVGGLCDSGPHVGAACTINSLNPTFGDLSFDCPPLPTAILATLPVPLNLATGTQTWSLGAGSPSCTAPGYTSLKCFCDTCDNENAEPCSGVGQCSKSCIGGTNNGFTCTDPSECPGGICNGGQCGGRRCQGGTNVGTPCTTGSQCPGGGCGIPGKATAYNQCDDAVCTPNPSDTDSSSEATCAGGPFEQFCSPWASFTQCVADFNCAPFNRCVGGTNNGFVGCTVDSQCPGGVCEIQTCSFGKFRECFTDNGVIGTHCFGGTNGGAVCSAASECPDGFCGGGSVTASGVPYATCNGSGTGTVASLFCVGPNSSGSINAVVGTPGLGRATLPTTVTFN